MFCAVSMWPVRYMYFCGSFHFIPLLPHPLSFCIERHRNNLHKINCDHISFRMVSYLVFVRPILWLKFEFDCSNACPFFVHHHSFGLDQSLYSTQYSVYTLIFVFICSSAISQCVGATVRERAKLTKCIPLIFERAFIFCAANFNMRETRLLI